MTRGSPRSAPIILFPPTCAPAHSVSPQDSFGIDALIYFGSLYPYYGLKSETITGGGVTRLLQDAAYQRYDVEDPLLTNDAQIIVGKQGANVSPFISRAYYKLLRLMSHVYVVAGWTGAGPSDSIERHIQ